MQLVLRSLFALLLTGFALPAGAQTGGEAYVHASGELSMVDGGRPERRRVVFRAGWPASATAAMEDPRVAGASLRLAAASGEGDTGAIVLPFVRWRGLGHPAGQGGLDLLPDVAYQNLVDVFSPAGQMNRVTPGDEKQSFLWRKLAKATLALADVPGAAMPNGLAPIPEAQLEALKIWIRAGAPATGVVGGTESLLSSCLPAADPVHIRAPAPPAPQDGVQLHAPAWPLAARDEDEVCFATYYDF